MDHQSALSWMARSTLNAAKEHLADVKRPAVLIVAQSGAAFGPEFELVRPLYHAEARESGLHIVEHVLTGKSGAPSVGLLLSRQQNLTEEEADLCWTGRDPE